MKLFEILIRLLAIVFRVPLEILVTLLRGIRELLTLLLDDLLIPFLEQIRGFVDQLEIHGIRHARDERPEPPTNRWQIWMQ